MMQLMEKMNKDFICEFPNILSPELCEQVINDFEEKLNHDPGIDLKRQHGGANHRSGTALYVRVNDGWGPTRDIINQATGRGVQAYYDEYPTIISRSTSHTIKLQRTKPGEGFHDWHCEAFNAATCHRVLFWMIYLNTTPEGEGTTEWINQGVKVQPEQGKLVICPSGFTHAHRGNPTYTDTKYVATGWYTHQGE